VKKQLSNRQIGSFISALVVILMSFGVIFVASASVRLDREYDFRRMYAYPEFRQGVFFLFSVLTLYVVSLFDYRRLRFKGAGLRRWFIGPLGSLVGFSIILLLIVLLFADPINQARRWLQIPLGPITISFQVSEFAKWSLIFFLAAAISQIGDEIRLFWSRFVPLCAIAGVVIGLIVIEDFGTAFFVSVLTFAMIFVGGARLWHF